MGGKLRENLLDDHWIFDTGDHFERTAEGAGYINIEFEDALEPLHPAHSGPRSMAVLGSAKERTLRGMTEFALVAIQAFRLIGGSGSFLTGRDSLPDQV